MQRLSRAGRYRFLSTLRRVSIGGLAKVQDGKFGDILLADALTSYAKVLGDLYVALCMFLSSGYSSTGKPDRGCGGQFMVPLIISLPSLIRLRQCLIEYFRVRGSYGTSKDSTSSGWGGQHLANALKYSTAFPVIILSASQRGYNPDKFGMSETSLFRLWCVVFTTIREVTLANGSHQAILRLFEFVLFILLGCGQGLGSQFVLFIKSPERPCVSLWTSASSFLPLPQRLLHSGCDRLSSALHVEF